MPISISGDGPITGITSLNTTVNSTELGYLDGTTSAIQTQINAKPTGNTGAWTSYTPIITNWTIGNGSVVGKYAQIGNLIVFRSIFTAGSTSTFVGNFRMSIPITATSGSELLSISALAFDSSAGGYYYANVLPIGTSAFELMWRSTSVTYSVGAGIPFTPASSDVFYISGFYEAA